MIDFMIFWPTYVECFAENYSPQVVRRIRDNPRTWLNTLPMTEYAHVLMFITAHNLGGEPTKYVTELYNQRMSPVLKEYYQELELYRMKRAMAKRRYFETEKYLEGKSANELRTCMRMCTRRTRELLRKICEDYQRENEEQNRQNG